MYVNDTIVISTPCPTDPLSTLPCTFSRAMHLALLYSQLFMVPALRKAILEARLPRRKLEDFPHELVGRRVALQWEAGGSFEAYVHSYNERTGAFVCFSFALLAICAMCPLTWATALCARPCRIRNLYVIYTSSVP